MIKKNTIVIENLYSILFGLGVLLLPFVWWPAANVAYELPRVWFVHRWVDVLFVVSLIGFKFLPKKILDMKLFGLMILFVGVAVLASLLGADLTKSVVGNYWRGDGLVTLVRMAGLAIMVGLWWGRRLKQICYWSNLLAVLGISIWMIGESLVNGLTPRGVSFGNPVLLTGWLVVAGALALTGFKVNKFKWIPHVVAGGVLTAILLTQAWSALLLWLFVMFVRFKKLRLLMLAVLLLGVVWWWRKEAQVEYLRDGEVVYESRERIFRKVWGGAWQRPILGWGWANVDLAFNSYIWPYPVQNDVYLDKAHSSLLEVFATSGLVGLMAYLILLGRAGWCLRKSDLLLPFIIFVLHAQTNVVGIGQEVYFWIFAGIAMGTSD